MDHKISHSDEIKVKVSGKVVTSIIITAIVVFILTFAIFKYLPDQKKENEITSYKKQIYDSILCQYSCPLTEQQTSGNKTQMLPEQTCVQQCAGNTEENREQNAKFADNDLQSDNLYMSIENLVTTCKNSAIEQVGQLPQLNNTKFFDCVKQGLIGLKANYGYLN